MTILASNKSETGTDFHSGDLMFVKKFYRCFIHSVVTSGTTCWGGNASKQDKNRLDKNI